MWAFMYIFALAPQTLVVGSVELYPASLPTLYPQGPLSWPFFSTPESLPLGHNAWLNKFHTASEEIEAQGRRVT